MLRRTVSIANTSRFSRLYGWFLITCFASQSSVALAKAEIANQEPDAITLHEVLDKAVSSSQRVQTTMALEVAAAADVGIAKAGYLPTAEFQLIDSIGFPGSSSALGISGIAGSPYRSGLAGGFVVQQQIWDFGLTDAKIHVAEKDVDSRRVLTQFEAQRAQLAALAIFTKCSEQQSEAKFYKHLVKDTQLVAKEVGNFVRTGQRTVVDRYLAEAQVQQAKTSLAEAEARVVELEKALALAIGAQGRSPQCPGVASVAAWKVAETVPYIEAAIADLQVEEARRELIRSEYTPKINLLGSLGLMERSRLVDKASYALGVGISVPLFNGFKEDYQLDRSAALITSKRLEVAARKYDLSQTNAHYDELIVAAQTRLDHLRGEEELANKALNVARQRYFESEGSLTDLREAIRNFSRANSEMIRAQAALFEASSERALVNSGKLLED